MPFIMLLFSNPSLQAGVIDHSLLPGFSPDFGAEARQPISEVFPHAEAWGYYKSSG